MGRLWVSGPGYARRGGTYPDRMTQPTDRRLALRVSTLPRDTNPYGTIFGGVILSYIDQAGAIEARRHAHHRWVTVALDRVEFKQPVRVGDLLNLYAWTVKTGRTSVTVRVEVEAERFDDGSVVGVTSATLVMVSVDHAGRAIPFAEPRPLAGDVGTF